MNAVTFLNLFFCVSLGTSGSRTPDDDLDTSNFGAPRKINSPRSSNENLAEDDKVSPTRESSYSVMSRSSSSYSVAPSFSSDFPDTESLLPDLSDTVGSNKYNSLESVGLPDKDTRIVELQSESRIRSFSGNTDTGPRPRTLGLVKRNSDLPGRVQRVDEFNSGFFPIGMKTSASDTNLNKDPYAIEEEAPFIAISEAANASANRMDDEFSSIEKDGVIDVENQSASHSEPAMGTHVDSEVPAPMQGGVSQDVAPSEIMISPIQSPTKEKSLPSPRKMEPPPISKKPARSPSMEKKDFASPEKSTTEEVQSVSEVPSQVGSRELIIPVMTALQERRSSTPNCSTAQASTDTKVPDRVQSPVDVSSDVSCEVDEKKPEAKVTTRAAYTSRVSVRDRLQQYERNRSGNGDAGRRPSDHFNPTSVASRKQMFEQKERGLYKRVSDMGMRKPRSDSGSGSGSASGSPKFPRKRFNDSEDGNSVAGVTSPVSGSPKLSRKRLNDSVNGSSVIAAACPRPVSPEKTKPVEQDTHVEPRRRTKKDRSEKADRPRSLVLDNLDKMESVRSSRPRSGDFDSLKLDLEDGEKETLSPREIDIPLDDGLSDRHRSDRPRRSPNTSPRNSRANVRSPFPDDTNEVEREPQFV